MESFCNLIILDNSQHDRDFSQRRNIPYDTKINMAVSGGWAGKCGGPPVHSANHGLDKTPKAASDLQVCPKEINYVFL